jgi:hypothetical protein
VRSVRLDEVIRNFWMLQRTVSHWHWGNFQGINEDGRFVIVPQDGFPWRARRVLRFDVSTGAEVR